MKIDDLLSLPVSAALKGPINILKAANLRNNISICQCNFQRFTNGLRNNWNIMAAAAATALFLVSLFSLKHCTPLRLKTYKIEFDRWIMHFYPLCLTIELKSTRIQTTCQTMYMNSSCQTTAKKWLNYDTLHRVIVRTCMYYMIVCQHTIGIWIKFFHFSFRCNGRSHHEYTWIVE